MRLSVLICALAVGTGSAFAAETAGVYTHLELENARDCAQACDDDSLCVAWTFAAPSDCAFSAVAPTADANKTLISGLSSHAPAFVRRQMAAASPVVVSEPAASTPTQQTAAAPAPAAMVDAATETALLGGPDEGTLRPQLN